MDKLAVFLANVTSVGKCAIYVQMCHLWANVPFMGKCTIYGQMCHLWATVTSMGKRAIYGKISFLLKSSFDNNVGYSMHE